MLKQIFLWCIGRLEASIRESERKLAIGARAAHAMVLHLYGLPVTRIDVSDTSQDPCLLRSPGTLEEMMHFVQCSLLATAAQRMAMAVAQDLLKGYVLVGFSASDGRLLNAGDDIVDRADSRVQALLQNEELADDRRAFFIDIVAKRLISHYYLAIVTLSSRLLKQPIVIGEEECRKLFEECLKEGPVNSLNVQTHDNDQERTFQALMAKRLRETEP